MVTQPGLQLVHDHEGIHAAFAAVADQRVRDLVLDVAGRDAVHPLAHRLLAQLLDVVLGEAGQGLAVVQLHLLHQGQLVLLGILQAGQHRPHGRGLQRVRGDVFPADLGGVVVLLVDPPLFGDAGDVRDVDFHRPVPQRLHELVRQQLLVFGLVGVAQDHLVDVRLGELLRLDLVLLRRAQQVVEEGHVQLQHLDELDDAAVGDVELAVEVERPRIAVRSELGDLAVVDVAGQLGRVLILLVLGLESPDSHPILLGQDQPADPHVFHHLRPVPLVVEHQLAEDQPAGRIEVPLHVNVRRAGDVDPQVDQGLLAPLERDQSQRLLVHGALELALTRPRSCASDSGKHPIVGVHGPFGVREYSSSPRLISRAMVDFELPTGPCSRITRRSVP